MDTKRNFEIELEARLRKPLNFIQAIIGPRQVGKTTAVARIYAAWRGPKLSVSADGPAPPGPDWIELHWSNARSMGPGTLLVLDEVQKVVGWAEVVKRLFDAGRASRELTVLILGSASLSLQQGLLGALAGRFELLRANHWTYPESREAFGFDLTRYLRFGCYPAAAELTDAFPRWQSFIRDSIVEPVLGKDISGTIRIAKPALFRQTFQLAMAYPSQVISLQKLLGQLQEGGNVSTVKHYLELFEAAFLIRCLDKYSTNPLQTKSSSPKLLPLTPALPNAFKDSAQAIEDPVWQGRIFESVVGAHLATLPGRLCYWQEGHADVDFVRVVDDRVIAYEVKSTRSTDMPGLLRFRHHFPKAEAMLINLDSIESFLAGEAGL